MKIIVGVTGGIAAYKVVGVIRALVLDGHDVHVIPTESALKFVGAPTFEAISRNPLATDLYEGVAEVRHVALGQSADVILVAPATANTIARITAGLADDLLGNSILASKAPLVIAPAMHTEMWQNPATAHNVATLRERGVRIVGPGEGRLTGRDSGIGRLADENEIVSAVLEAGGHGRTARDLDGRRIVISAGGTREPIDPVRFIGNRSSGRQGVALAEAAKQRGADVLLVAANLEIEVPAGIESFTVTTTAQLREAMLERAASADVVIMAAAVADYRPEDVSDTKMKKEADGGPVTLRLVQNPDILTELGHADRRARVLVGFAAETTSDEAELIRLAAEKRERKGCDLIAVNRVDGGRGFGAADNEVRLIDANGPLGAAVAGSKSDVAHAILDAARDLLRGRD
ncbi:phosphopantothenoylcysteine decarboxylase / phosphopantothenate--cysteine ligase [Paramicrobacterium humi]|uniref:Coenzyme A biosynthesis bifunctional protein CoaBC n=1 Tax=Paramicrobacterium humi TaxID=640635 RepID=A0A1H4MHJ4_9MICO|nr:bifunctional phosphopantothenoylcysteine decarboxylase/phosphopantothenate--cysteine ligase CoaBC [Microbacterium humi]SEB82469.1 phosphopantothenoylcysteine decarboxylase / phosphopantothenate--cysteine ligase [Microbacterium humi]